MDSTVVSSLNSLAQSIDKLENSTTLSNHMLFNATARLETISDSLCNSINIEPISDLLFELNNHLDTISQTLATPNTVWGMSEGLARILIPSLVSLLVFVSGILINALTSRNRVVSFKDTILFWCKQLLPQIENQSKSMAEFSDNLSMMDELQGVQLKKYQLPVQQLTKISLDRFIHAFKFSTRLKKNLLTKEQRKKGLANKEIDYYSHGLFSQFSYLDELHSRAFKEYDEYRNEVKYYIDEWNVAFQKVKDSIDWIVANSNDVPANQLNTIIINWMNSVKPSLLTSEYEKYFIFPVNNWASNNLTNTSYGDKAYSIRTGIMKLCQIIHLYRMMIKGYSDRFAEFSSNYSAAYESIKNSSEFFDRTSAKCFVKSF